MPWFAIPFTIHAIRPFRESGCKAWPCISINRLAGAAFERYNTINRATRGQGFFNKKSSNLFCSFSLVLLAGFQRCSVNQLIHSCRYWYELLYIDWSSSSRSAISYTVALHISAVFCFHWESLGFLITNCTKFCNRCASMLTIYGEEYLLQPLKLGRLRRK